MRIDVNSVLTHFALIVEFKEEHNWQFDQFATLFVVPLRCSLPNGPVALNDAGFFNVRPVTPSVLKSREELLNLLAPSLRGTLVHVVVHGVFSEGIGERHGVEPWRHIGIQSIDEARQKDVGVLGSRWPRTR